MNNRKHNIVSRRIWIDALELSCRNAYIFFNRYVLNACSMDPGIIVFEPWIRKRPAAVEDHAEYKDDNNSGSVSIQLIDFAWKPLLLYIVDKPGSSVSLDDNDFSSPKIIKVRKHVLDVIEHWISIFLKY